MRYSVPRSTHARRKRPLRAFLLTLAAGCASTLLFASGAAAAVTCAYNATTFVAAVNLGAYDSATVGRSLAGNITVDGVNCGAATTANTDTIRIAGPNSGSEDVTLDLANGPLAPGKTAEATPASEIEIYLILGGGYGSLTVEGAAAADNITAGSGGINLNNGAAGDTDIDLFRSGVENFTFNGNDGADILSAGGSAITGQPMSKSVVLAGGSGSDTLTGGNGSDTISGEADTSSATTPGDTLNGGFGDDDLNGGPGKDVVSGGPDGDTIVGGDGNDVLNGGPGYDTFEPDFVDGIPSAPDGADIITGGPGGDTLDLSDRTSRVRVSLDNVANDGADVDANGIAEEGDNVKSDVEDVYGGALADVITADTPAANIALANNSLNGGQGNDQLLGGAGDDYLSGDEGDDNLSGGPDEDGLYGDIGVDTLHGGDDSDDLYGDDGGDQLFGDAGDDYFNEESFDDGPDNISGGLGNDSLSYHWRVVNLLISLDNLANDGADENPALAGAEEKDNVHADIEQIEGGSANDTINANTTPANAAYLDNILDGNAGVDRLFGGSGDDLIRGGDGNDAINGNTGEDSIDGEDGADSLISNDVNWYDEVDCGYGDGVADPAPARDAFDLLSNCP